MQKIEWFAPEHIYREKNSDWYWIVGIVTLSIAIISTILNNLIFGILILVSAFTLSLFSTRKPEIIKTEITEREIIHDGLKYPFEDISSFWVETRDAYPRLFLRLQKKLSLPVVILLEETDPQQVKKALADHIEEEEMTEPLLEKILIYFGF